MEIKSWFDDTCLADTKMNMASLCCMVIEKNGHNHKNFPLLTPSPPKGNTYVLTSVTFIPGETKKTTKSGFTKNA